MTQLALSGGQSGALRLASGRLGQLNYPQGSTLRLGAPGSTTIRPPASEHNPLVCMLHCGDVTALLPTNQQGGSKLCSHTGNPRLLLPFAICVSERARDMSVTEVMPGMLGPERVLESAHALMSAAMIDAKRARMRVEGERQMLANRLSRLQAEELRATKRIEETVRRLQPPPVILLRAAQSAQHQERELMLPQLRFLSFSFPCGSIDGRRRYSRRRTATTSKRRNYLKLVL